MAQYNPQAQQGSGRGGGGRGGYQGRGGGPQQPQQGRPMGAWQPSAPTSSLQQAAYGRQAQQGGYHPHPHQHHHHNQHQHHQSQHHHNQHHQHAHPQAGPPGPHGPPGPPPYQLSAAPHHYNPYAPQGPFRGNQGGPGGWQPTGYPPQGGVYYPPANAGHPGAGAGGASVVIPPKPREKKPLVITDKNGNVLDFRSESAQKKSSLKAAVAAEKNAEEKPASSVDPGSKLREAALARLKKDDSSATKELPDDGPSPKTTGMVSNEDETVSDPQAQKSNRTPPAPATTPACTSSKLEQDRTTEPLSSDPASQPSSSDSDPAEAPSNATAPGKAVQNVESSKSKSVPAVTPDSTGKTPATTLSASPAPAKPVFAAATAKPGGSSLATASNKGSVAVPTPPPKVSAGGLRPGGKTRLAPKGRIVYDKTTLLRLKASEASMKRPEGLPDMTIVKGPAKQQGGGGRRHDGRGNWDRGQQPQRRNSQNNQNNNDNWQRGQAPPKNQNRNKGGRRNSQNGGNQPPLFDGPIVPLKKSENRWKPSKNTSPLMAAEKQVKGILNKMTKEKFDRLSAQMCDIQILSYDMLTMMIHNVYEKAIDEPAFGDMYADLCVKLSKGAAQANNDFVKVIESDEEPPTEGDAGPVSRQAAESSSHIVYRWSNDVSTTDNEIVGPFSSPDACIDAALEDSGEPVPRGNLQLELVKLCIKKGTFIKVMKKKASPDGSDAFYTVYFSVEEAEECGQQLSEIFLSEVECVSNAKKKNSFKRSLLNKCEDEFKKQDIYVDWKKEKKDYEESKSKLTPTEQAEREEELDFRRIKIKKQMLGNIKFIGQLYKKGLLKEKIMRFCIGSLLKLEELSDVRSKNPEYKDSGDMDMDEEDHEAICSMFTTIGSTIDKLPAAEFMKVCFTKIRALSVDKKNLPARSRFMYKDLLELRENNWVPRRDEGKAKTLEEIRKDVEREEKRQAQQSQQNYRNDSRRTNQPTGGYDNRRGGSYGGRGGGGGANRNRQSTKQQETDDDGFTVIARGTKGHFQVGGGGGGGNGASQRSTMQKQSIPKSGSKSNFAALAEEKKPVLPTSVAAPLPPDKFERRVKIMRAEFMQDPSNVSELLLSMDELSGTKDAGLTLVLKSMDALLNCKDAERNAVSDVIRILFENGKLSKNEIRGGLSEFIEFIDSMVMDCPRLYEYVGDLLSSLFNAGAVDAQWLCDALEKTKVESEDAAEKLTQATISCISSHAGVQVAAEAFSGASSAMNALLGPDKWNAISKELLG